MTAKQLLHSIEECREKMIDLASYSSMLDIRVIEASTKLDILINEYINLTKKQ